MNTSDAFEKSFFPYIAYYILNLKHHIIFVKEHLLDIRLYLNSYRLTISKSFKIRQKIFDHYLSKSGTMEYLVLMTKLAFLHCKIFNERVIIYWIKLKKYLDDYLNYYYRVINYEKSIKKLVEVYLTAYHFNRARIEK